VVQSGKRFPPGVPFAGTVGWLSFPVYGSGIFFSGRELMPGPLPKRPELRQRRNRRNVPLGSHEPHPVFWTRGRPNHAAMRMSS